jgi:cytochrome c556
MAFAPAALACFRRSRARLAMTLAVLFVGVLASAFDASGQDQGAAIAKDAIQARKGLMDAISDNSDRIASMISAQEINVSEARACADTIAVMLTAFPHLFPPQSNQWREGVDADPLTGTSASPDIWTNFADFYRIAATAAERADELRHADNEEDIKSLHRALGNVCDYCHALYMKE